MNQKKFIELLNLFVDHEISAAEAAELEQEIARNPERRKLYQQYCRIQRGSEMLASSFKSEAAPIGAKLARAARSADDKLAQFPERRVSQISWGWISGLGVAAAAACVAFMVIRSDGPLPSSASSVSPVIAQQAPISHPVQATAAQSAAPRVSPFTPTLVAQALPRDIASGSFVSTGVNAPSLEWMDRVEIPSLRSIPVEELMFEAKNGLQPEPKTFRSGRPMQGKVEMSAFQFEK